MNPSSLFLASKKSISSQYTIIWLLILRFHFIGYSFIGLWIILKISFVLLDIYCLRAMYICTSCHLFARCSYCRPTVLIGWDWNYSLPRSESYTWSALLCCLSIRKPCMPSEITPPLLRAKISALIEICSFCEASVFYTISSINRHLALSCLRLSLLLDLKISALTKIFTVVSVVKHHTSSMNVFRLRQKGQVCFFLLLVINQFVMMLR
jgi:hypothetical protein